MGCQLFLYHINLSKSKETSKSKVTPRAGVWIEMSILPDTSAFAAVTPRAGVWIEIKRICNCPHAWAVTPRAGVWIEILQRWDHEKNVGCHSPCGSVD